MVWGSKGIFRISGFVCMGLRGSGFRVYRVYRVWV